MTQKLLAKTLHILLVLILTLALLKAVWHALSLLIADAKPPPPPPVDNGPSMQDIAESLNTFWLSYDFDHCRNVCMVSRVACKLRGCVGVPGTKAWD
ncbi:hypothetical protein CC80DRAFT_556014 [Byssothecium circinans]|uniref:Uncharacterized protein n=1 Tax=Byssothecium circinans TaxID=147558 RepID=A0A6A5T955_9PLEO|nr:hypothetical protein CC80DRAFT_556014 [Byssothecium circinans]